MSDGPALGSGLGRIARDLTALLHQNAAALNIRVAQLGMYHDRDAEFPWPVWPVLDTDSWGAGDLERVWWKWAGEKGGVVFTIWDGARCFDLREAADRLPVRMWGYFPIDGVNAEGTIGGPAGEAIKRYDRVLGYGRWGAGVLKKIRGEKVSYLPHGIETGTWAAPLDAPTWQKLYIGAVATNQPRKDLGLLFEAWAILKKEQPGLRFWLHTDREVTQWWSVPELARIWGFGKELLVTTDLDDAVLAALYQQCWVTVAPGLGEGFGYPQVESLAAGVPCVSIEYAGGAELNPRSAWRVPPTAWRCEGPYVVRRPVVRAEVLARRVAWAIDEVRRDPVGVGEYCKGAVAHLDWQQLWPRWRAWFAKGIAEVRG